MLKNVSALDLTPGAWTARWGAWLILLRTVGDFWDVRIWSHVRGVACVQLAKRAVFPTSAAAVGWACDVLRQHGAIVLVDGQVRALERFLAYSLAPDAVACS